jgi:hypothetical protein
MSPWLALVILGLLVIGVVLWRFLPVGKLYGRTIRLHEWHHWRHNLRWDKIDRHLGVAKSLPSENRLQPLTKLAFKHFREPLGKGDSIVEEIGALGTEESLPLITNLLRDAPDISAKPLLRGLQSACQNANVSTKWRNTLFEALAAHVDEPEWPGRNGYFNHYFEVLLALDGARAMELFCTPARMNPDQPDLKGLLRAINSTESVIPRPLIQSLLTSGVGEALPDGTTSPALEVLEAWAAHDPAESKAELWKIIHAGGDKAVEAAESLLGLEDLPHPRFAIDARVARLSLGGVGAKERTVWLVDRCYIYPLSCSPLITFFEEDYADCFEAIIAALQTIGALKHAGWLAEAGALFGKDGPGRSPQERALQMAAMLHSASERFQAFEDEKPTIHEDVKLLNLIYVLDHASEFPRGLSFLGKIQK